MEAQATERGPSRAAGPDAFGCAWCGARAALVAPRLAACPSCGAGTTAPAPDDAELEEAYGGSYRPDQGRFLAGGDYLLRRSRGTLARGLVARAPAGPILDVGCGEGALLDALEARGREALGLERESHRADVRAIDILHFDERPGRWAAIVFWHSLEHLRRPRAAVERAIELLAPGGLLVIAMPNWGSWQARLFGRSWLALDIPRHLVHLPDRTLLDGLRRGGLVVERVSYVRGGQVAFGWLHGLVSRLPGAPDLYDAIRRPDANSTPLGLRRRLATLAAGIALAPLAVALAAVEAGARAGGSVYVEARKP
jgi:SAM-dependent methyltransferase